MSGYFLCDATLTLKRIFSKWRRPPNSYLFAWRVTNVKIKAWRVFERTICAYTWVSKIWVIQMPKIRNSGHSYTFFFEKMWFIIYLAWLNKEAIQQAHSYYVIYRESPPPLQQTRPLTFFAPTNSAPNQRDPYDCQLTMLMTYRKLLISTWASNK